MKRVVPMIAVIALLGLLPSTAAAAKSTVEFSCLDTLVSVQPGEQWIEDGALHVRGQIMTFAGGGDSECAGTLTGVINFNLDLTDWSGALWGTFDRTAVTLGGGWIGTFTGHWTTSNPLAPTATHYWAGRIVGRGYGDIAGWQLRSSSDAATHMTLLSTSSAWSPGS